MMSPDNFPAKPTDDDQSCGSSRKPTTPIKPSDQALKCPRCDSPNTKFCYYNNYSLTQPRHFCKTCRRYWTKGGALRNVPIGGGCRKSKKSRSASRLSGDQRDSESPSDTGNLKYFHGLSAAMEFPLGGLPFSRLHSNTNSVFNQYISFGDLSSALPSPTTGSLETGATSGSSLVGFNYPIPSVGRQGESAVFNGGLQELGSMNVHSSIASTIESLSSINQDLHWKLQQQRLAMFFGGENQKESTVSVVPSLLLENQQHQQQQQQQQEQQPISFQTPESSKSTEICVSKNTNEWFFENSYTPTNNNINNTNINNNTINWNGIQTWSDLHQYSVLP